jgi:hypothetical protein
MDCFKHKAIHHRRQHAHGVADWPRHAARRHLHAAENIAAAHDDAELNAELGGRREIRGETFDCRLIDAETVRSRQRLAGQFDDNATIDRVTHALRSVPRCGSPRAEAADV